MKYVLKNIISYIDLQPKIHYLFNLYIPELLDLIFLAKFPTQKDIKHIQDSGG